MASPAPPVPLAGLFMHLRCRGQHLYARQAAPGAPPPCGVDVLFGPCPGCCAPGGGGGGEEQQEAEAEEAQAAEEPPSFHFCFRGDELHVPGIFGGAAGGAVRRVRAGAREEFAAWVALERRKARERLELEEAIQSLTSALRALSCED